MTRLARWARAEWGPLYAAVRGPLLSRGRRAVPVTLAAVALTALLQLLQNQPWGYGPVQAAGAVRAADPLWLALLRTPLSLFVPALDLPVWGALAQVLCVFGVAEICLGRARTLAVAYAATLAGTLYARLAIHLGPGTLLGLPASEALVVDTGPSAAVVGLAILLARRHGAYTTAAAVTAAMVVEAALNANLAGREHLAAIAAVTAPSAARSATHCLRRTMRQTARRASPQDPSAFPGVGSGRPPRASWNLRRGPAQRRSWW
jgi:hypothetical protein